MKKSLTLLFVLIFACTMVFAIEQNLKIGAGFNYGFGTVSKPDDTTDKIFTNRYLKHSAVELNIGYDAELENNLVIYNNLGLGYNLNMMLKGESDWISTTTNWEDAGGKSFVLQEELGAGYAFYINQIRFVAGGGVHLKMILGKADDGKLPYFGFLGAGLNLEGSYSINEKLSVNVRLLPSCDFFSFWKVWKTDSSSGDLIEWSCTGIAPSFNGSAIAGISYRF